MKVLVIYCHPVETSFVAALHRDVLDALCGDGHEVTDVDLYAEDFDPVMSRQERLNYNDTNCNFNLVEKYVKQLQSAQAIVLIYPTWSYHMPAILQGYFDRVWLPGVAFDISSEGSVLANRLQHVSRFVVITTYGSPWWFVRLYLGDPSRKILRRGLARLFAPNCRIDWYVQYHMDRANRRTLSNFLDRVRSGMHQL